MRLSTSSLPFRALGTNLAGLALLALAWGAFAPLPAQATNATIPDEPPAPTVTNPSFECSQGVYPLPGPQGVMQVPVGWSVVFLDGAPWVNSARMHFTGGCGGGWVERLEFEDSLTVLAQDIETPPEPGKPFDLAVYQQVSVEPGHAYSFSGWMVSLCGGSAVPNDCPEEAYMAKMLGLDPTGGTDPLADTVIWVEDRRNFIENGQRVGWVDQYLAATAQGNTMTLFGRIRSPFRWHGNHAFMDAFSLVVAPEAHFVDLNPSPPDFHLTVTWAGSLSSQIAAIPGQTYGLLFELQYKVGENGVWQPWLAEQPAGSAVFYAQQPNTPHYIRVRARAEQGPNGAWPNHRYPSVWTVSPPILFQADWPPLDERIYLPVIQR